MHYLTLKQQMYLRRHADNSHSAAVRWKEWRRVANGGVPSHKVIIFRDGKRVRAKAQVATPMPKVFCRDQNPEETLAFLARMRSAVLGQAVEYQKREAVEQQRRQRFSRPPARRRRPPRNFLRSYFDFKSLRVISPTAALVLAALYDRRKAITGFRPITIDEHLWKPNIIRLLRSVGFHELLEMRAESDDTGAEESIRVLKFVSGEQVAGQELGNLQNALAEFLPQDDRERLLYAEPYSGMIEAALNSHMWAYPKGHTWDFPAYHVGG